MIIDTSTISIGSGVALVGLVLGHLGTLRGIGFLLERLGRVLQRIPGKPTVASVGTAVMQEIAATQTETPTPNFTAPVATPAPQPSASAASPSAS